MPIYKTAQFAVRPAGLAKSEAAIREVVAYVRANEPDTRLYTSLQREDEPTQFIHVMVFADEAAERRHRSSAAVKRSTSVLYPETVDGVSFTDYTLVATVQD